jgi:septum formation protein
MKLVLASGSPRRHDLLTMAGFHICRVAPPQIEESRHAGEGAVAFAGRMAREKAAAVPLQPGEIALAADTVVHVDDEVLGKPTDTQDNHRMLRRLAGRPHQVTTGWCIRHADGQVVGTVSTTVHFRDLTPAEISTYGELGEGEDKAGGYGIQGAGAALISHVEGDHTNVVGLPLNAVVPVLRSLGVK